MLVMTLANSPILLDCSYTNTGNAHLGEISFRNLTDAVSSLFDSFPAR